MKKRVRLGLNDHHTAAVRKAAKKALDMCKSAKGVNPDEIRDCKKGVFTILSRLKKESELTARGAKIAREFSDLDCTKKKREASCKAGVEFLLLSLDPKEVGHIWVETMLGKKRR